MSIVKPLKRATITTVQDAYRMQFNQFPVVVIPFCLVRFRFKATRPHPAPPDTTNRKFPKIL